MSVQLNTGSYNNLNSSGTSSDDDKTSSTKKYSKQVYRYREIENSDKKSLVDNYS